jgi:hypothetical protein
MTISQDIDRLVVAIQSHVVDPKNAISILKQIVKIVKGNTSAVVEIVSLLARGADGISGTADDVIPPATVAALRALLDSDLVGNLAAELGHVGTWTWPCCSISTI